MEADSKAKEVGHTNRSSAEPIPTSSSRLQVKKNVVLSSSPNFQPITLQEVGRLNSIPDPEQARLDTPWTFWFERSPRRESMEDFSLRKLCEVQNIKAFWGAFNNITPVESLNERNGYHLMRGNVEPTWEGNPQGGYWSFICSKDRTQDVWTEILLAAVGEQLSESVDEGDDVVGVSVRIRDREDMIQIWNKDSVLAHKATVADKLRKLCPDLDARDKYIACREKMTQKHQPLRPYPPEPFMHPRGPAPPHYPYPQPRPPLHDPRFPMNYPHNMWDQGRPFGRFRPPGPPRR